MRREAPLAGAVRARAHRLQHAAGHLLQPVAAIVARGIEIVVKFIFQLVVARSLGSAEAGLLLLSLSIASVVQCAAKFSIDRALIRSVARLRNAGNEGGAFAEIVSALCMILVLALAVGAVLFTLAAPVAGLLFHKPALALPLRWISAAIVFLCLLNGIVGALTGLGIAALGDALRNIVWPALCAVLLLALGLTDAVGASAAAAASTMIAVLVAWATLRRVLPVRWPRLHELKLPDNLRAIALPLWAVDTIDVILTTVPTIVLGAVGTAADVGVFSVANRIALIFVAILTAIGNATSPRLVLLLDENNRERLGRTMRDVTLLGAVVATPLAAALLVFPDRVMGLFGPDFVSGATVLRILVVGNLIFMLFGCTSDLLAMSGHGRALRRIRVFTLGACTVMSLVTIPLFGSLGAAVTTAATMALSGFAAALAVRRRLQLPVFSLTAGTRGVRAPGRIGSR